MVVTVEEADELFEALRGLCIAHRLAMSDESGRLKDESRDLHRAERMIARLTPRA